MIEEIINFVTPFRQAIQELSDQQKPTLYLVVVWYTRLVQEMQPENTDSLLINALKAEARTQLLHVSLMTHSFSPSPAPSEYPEDGSIQFIVNPVTSSAFFDSRWKFTNCIELLCSSIQN